ncbi:general secretion pathway protein D [Haloferula luteola]|uniref:General secretion pathway protein D n=1 Tax=Haloferula luteola TaxID=595692 RepID=A0A840VI81_9BACT|nr:Amuc_1098 family type IV pilus outer membrane protein [Haloferula luteola]MBB5352421.1 general secretion pathway protein D [Haloferula luteola]
MRHVLLMTALLCGPSLTSVSAQGTSLADSEVLRRANASAEAQQLLVNGDEAYEKENYEDAAAAYRGAVELLPEGAPAFAEQRQAAVQRFAQASVEVARKARRLGDLEKAESALKAVLQPGMAPGDPSALAESEALLDPIRTNPASSKEHTSNIEEVKFLLYRAEGAYQLGKFDESQAVYEDVLRIDPTNTAARRGMERVASARSSYYQAAYDHTRAEMLSMVDGAWELQPPAPSDFTFDDVRIDGAGETVDYSLKVRQMEIPAVVMDDVTIGEAVEFVRGQATALDSTEVDPARRGVNIVVDVGGNEEILNRRFSLNLRAVPILQVLQYICQETGTVLVEQPFAIVIRPAGTQSQDMVSRVFRVPPDFLSSGAGQASLGSSASNDPFGSGDDASSGLVARRLTAQEVLESRGVTFPEGAMATFNAARSELRVQNTMSNLSMVQQVVDALASNEPTSVIVEVKVIRTSQRNLEELGFDWLMSSFGFAGEGGQVGMKQLFLAGGTQGNGGSLSDVSVGSIYETPVTAGNRSGQEAIPLNSIDDLIANRDRISQSTVPRAPGFLTVNGYIDDGLVTMLMRGMSQKKAKDVLVQPSVITRSGQAASVRVVRELIFPSEYEPPELPNSVGGSDFVDFGTGGGGLGTSSGSAGSFPVTPSTPSSFDMREVGMVLDVLPTVSANKDYVDITLKPSLVEFDGFVNYGSPITSGSSSTLTMGTGFVPSFSSEPQVLTRNEILMPVFSPMRTESSLTVADGATIVVGAMLDEHRQSVDDHTPILGELPLVGRLFQSKVDAPVKTAVMFLVHVKVVDAAGRPFKNRN